MNREESSRLVSWKEIAGYLGVDERTCQRWEKKFGLPVIRLDDKGRSRVLARKEDLDRWLAASSKNGTLASNGDPVDPTPPVPENPAGSPKRKIGLRWMIGIVALSGLIVVAIQILPRIFSDRRPADFRIEGSTLVITNKAGRELWTFDAGRSDLSEDTVYRMHFQHKRLETDESGVSSRLLPWLIVRDINRDGRNEVLFAPQYPDEMDSGRMIALDHRGRALWDFNTGEDVRVGSKTFPRDFVLTGFDLVDLDEDGVFEIVAISHAKEQYPTRTLILDVAGKVRGAYWNAGQISDFAFRDFNRDFKPELLLSGQNNEYERPCLILLDPKRMAGGSPQGEAFRFVDEPPGTELTYVLFPLSPVEALKKPGIGIARFDLLSAERVRASINVDSIYYELDFSLRPLTVELSHPFERIYQEAFQSGRIKEPLDQDRIRRDLLGGFRWYNGQAKNWSPGWAMSNPWPGDSRK